MRQAGAEIEVTPEMVQVGVDMIIAHIPPPYGGPIDLLVKDVFKEMARLRPSLDQ